MRKWIAISLALLCVACLMIGCSSSGAYDGNTVNLPQLSEQDQAQLEADWLKETGQANLFWADVNEPDWNYNGHRYYGTYDGYIIFFNPMVTCVEWVIPIGNEIFGHSYCFNIYAYKDGEFLYLSDAYEQGLISDETISAVAKLHRSYERTYREERNQEYKENFPDAPTHGLPYWATEPTE